MSVVVILTVPHAIGCDDIDFNIHPCDTYGIHLANTLYKACVDHGVEVYDPLHGTLPRSVMDLNRKISRGTKYRTRLSSLVTSLVSQGKKTWVIDCHSFPQPGDYPTKNLDTEFVVLDTRDDETTTPYVTDLIDYLKSNGILAEDVRGSNSYSNETNDIMDTSRAEAAYSFLVEEREDVPEKHAQDAAKAFVEFIMNYSK